MMIVLFVILAIILIIQLILKLSKHSPTDIQILYIGMASILSYLLMMSYKLGTFVGEVKEFMKTTKNSFSKLKEEKDE
ncbi:MAG: hypothetical protein KKG75_04495 [Nanoarchaeota archaeon]|nr:hypothetical protein [Nanoarchaeota archaeon]